MYRKSAFTDRVYKETTMRLIGNALDDLRQVIEQFGREIDNLERVKKSNDLPVINGHLSSLEFLAAQLNDRIQQAKEELKQNLDKKRQYEKKLRESLDQDQRSNMKEVKKFALSALKKLGGLLPMLLFSALFGF